MPYTEANYENAVVILLSNLGYTCLYGPDINRDFHSSLYIDVLTAQLPRINSNADNEAVSEALYKLTHIENGTLIQQNKQFTDWLQNGIEVSYQKGGETKHYSVNRL